MPANSIELTLDALTFQHWARTFRNLLVGRVANVHPVDTFPLAGSLPSDLRFTGRRLLLQIGRACSRPEVMDDPSRLYGLLKYATSLSSGVPLLMAGGGRLRSFSLVPEVETLDTHKKAVMSDEFGCGMAFEFCSQALRAIFFLDVETAIRHNWLQTTTPRSRRPDYIGLTTGPQPWLVFEAKGSQSGDAYCRERQVVDGCAQLSNVQLVAGGAGSPVLLVVATALYRDDHRNISRIFVGDPEPNAPEPYSFNQNAIETVVRSHYARIATLTGDARLSVRLLNHEDIGEDADSALVVREVGNREYAGSRVEVRQAASSMEVFVGLDRVIRKELLAGNLGGISQRLREAPSGEFEQQTKSLEGDDERGKGRADAEADGTVLLLSRRGPIAEEDWNDEK